MQDSQPCPSCGAKNHASAAWCSQCYTPLGVPEAPQAPTIVADPVETEATVTTQTSDADVAKAGATWTCKACDTVNPVAGNLCAVCNTSIYTSFGAASEHEPLLDPQEALRYALIPGFAHIKMAQGMHGITIAVLVAALWFMGILLLFGGQLAVAIALLLISLVILAGSVHDAIRLAEQRPDEIVLKPRTLTIVGGAAVLMVIVVIWNQGLVS